MAPIRILLFSDSPEMQPFIQNLPDRDVRVFSLGHTNVEFGMTRVMFGQYDLAIVDLPQAEEISWAKVHASDAVTPILVLGRERDQIEPERLRDFPNMHFLAHGPDLRSLLSDQILALVPFPNGGAVH